MTLPKTSKSATEVEAMLDELGATDMPGIGQRGEDWPFSGGPEAEAIAATAASQFAGKIFFPFVEGCVSAKTFETDLVKAWLPYLNGGEKAWGLTTSGGSESIMLGVHTAIQRAKRAGKNTLGGEILAADTAWTAIDKVAQGFQLEIKRVPLNDKLQMDVEKTQEAITDRTVMIFASAPGFHYGTLDDIEGLGAVAETANVWLHVDACSGGLLAPFMERAGVNIPPWDFSVSGVRSISADPHKYGYSFPGASILFYKDKADFENGAFEVGPPIMFPTTYHTFTGTRSSASAASAWAVMHRLGDEGYEKVGAKIARAVRAIREGVGSMKGVKIYNDPKYAIVTFLIDDGARIMDVIGKLHMGGWPVIPLANPLGAFNMLVSPSHDGSIDRFLSDLETAMEAE